MHVLSVVMAGLDPAIPLGRALCHSDRDRRVTPLRGGPAMTTVSAALPE
jgi:hypothetical protein